MKYLYLIACGMLFAGCSSAVVQETPLPQETSTHQSTEVESRFYVDVRTQEEWNSGHVSGAIHVPLSDISEGKNIDRIPKDIPVYVYCRSGNRSGQAIEILKQHGYSNLINAGGIGDLSDVEIVQ